MRHLQISLLLIVALFATGCPKYRPKVNFSRNGFVKQINDHFEAQQKEYFKFLEDDKPDEAKVKRNLLIEDALPYIDEAYMDFITDLQAGRDRDNFLADVIELGAAATIASLKGTQRSIQLVGVGLTAFKGGRRSADLNFYKEQSTPVLISKMDGNRAKVRATILNRETEEISTYSIKAAIGDIVDYYNAGTLVRAFTELSKDTAIQTRAAEDRVLHLKGINPADIVVMTPDVTAAAKAIGTFRRLLIKDLKGTPAQKADATEKLRLIYLDIAKGDKSAQFKPILSELRKNNPSMASDMDKLEGADAISKAVSGDTTMDVISSIFSAIDLDKQGSLIVTLKGLIESRM